MIRKSIWFVITLAVVGTLASQWQDMIRYLKIKQMSAGDGHPENVPAGGTHRYGHS